MSIDKAREYLAKYGLDNKILEFDVSSATVPLAAKALGCQEARIAKTLSFKVEGEPILIVTAGDVKVDNSKYKGTFRTKAKMLASNETEELIGHAIGGVCPFGINDGVKVYTDVSLKRFDTLFPACGSANSAIEMTPEDIFKYSRSEDWVDVCVLRA